MKLLSKLDSLFLRLENFLFGWLEAVLDIFDVDMPHSEPVVAIPTPEAPAAELTWSVSPAYRYPPVTPSSLIRAGLAGGSLADVSFYHLAAFSHLIEGRFAQGFESLGFEPYNDSYAFPLFDIDNLAAELPEVRTKYLNDYANMLEFHGY